MADVIHCIFITFIIQEILPGTIALASFSLCFCVPASSLLFCHYYWFFPSLYYTFIANFALVFPAWEVVYLLLPHGRCFLLLCCCGLSRGHFNIFAFPAWEVLLFVCSLMVDVIHCIFITFYTTEFNPWYNSFSFSLCFYWHLVSLLSHFGVVKTLLYFLRHFKFFKLFVASWPMLFIPWCCCCLSRRLFIYLFVFCLFHMTGVCHIIIIIIIIIIILFFGDNFGLVFSGVRSSLTLSVTLSIVTTLY